MRSIFLFEIIILLLTFQACNKLTSSSSQQSKESSHQIDSDDVMGLKSFIITEDITLSSVVKTDETWRSELNEMEYYVIREKGTERSFTGEHWDKKAEGIYICKACNLPLYDSETKFKSGTGWPSYYQAIKPDYILKDTDYKLGYPRTEIMCARCEGHLGHVFNDGPEPTGMRHCVNSVSLDFIPKEEVGSFYQSLK